MPDEEMIALVRPGWIGNSRPPYKRWKFHKMKYRIGGPNFIRLPDGSLWAAGRQYGEKRTTVLARMTRDSYQPVLTLPSGGDCSYPGLIWHDGLLWMSYYSSHEGKTSIYLAKIRFEDANHRHFSARLARTGFRPRAECPDISPCAVHATTMPGLQSPPYAR